MYIHAFVCNIFETFIGVEECILCTVISLAWAGDEYEHILDVTS